MKITKFVHSCLLVEMPAPVNRTVLFDPGSMSEQALDVAALEFLDDIVITHIHSDHLSSTLLKKLCEKFPDVRITAPAEAVHELAEQGIESASSVAPPGMEFFDAPHENVQPLFPQPENIGIHYLELLTNPGDSHHIEATKPVLALPITAPWGATITALQRAIALKPQYVLPLHDWHWSDAAREQMYPRIQAVLAKEGISFVSLVTGEAVVLDV